MSNCQPCRPQGGDSKETVPKEDFLRILECPVCFYLPLPPIFNCARGHIICGKCRPKMTQCGLCQAHYTDSRNFVMEAMVNASRMACEYRAAGCRMVLRGVEFQDHVSSKCDFRPIACVFGERNNCKKSVVRFQEYAKHLVTVHGVTRVKETTDEAIFDKTYILRDVALTVSGHWPGMYTIFEGKAFVTRTFIDKGIFHFSLCVVGSESVAAGYRVRMMFKRAGDSRELDPIVDITMPVLPIRKTDEELMDCMHYSVPKGTFLRACGVGENPQSKQALTWQVKYTILPKIPSGSQSECCTM